ncbi:hypothetical protein [Paenibacillus sedimenti]|uniref:Uncharacterized protein n=1 Tax=Paenibacillus sedimenti TaxID=2770274 RepID=A0A926QI01_9BACL|nr:hypothetical protein [Paenibacillus sedimenti]MBD0380020.1 hypothetical protein [Paenibacillus sedimenti]
MFNMLIGCKKMVSIRYGKDDIRGVISSYYQAFRLLKINNILIPIELIEHIEVLEGNAEAALIPQVLREGRSLYLIQGGRTS